MEQTKKCSKCGEVKGLVEFHKRAEAKDGRRGVCKACDHSRLLAASRKYAENNKEKKAASFKAWYWRNRDAQIARVKAYADENAAELKQKRLATYQAEPEKFRKRASEYAKANRKKVNARHQKYVASRPELRAKQDAASMKACRKGCDNLSDSYVKSVFVAMGIAKCRNEVPPELIALKREQLAIKRMARELKKAATKPTGENE
jgi:hypothetical protein